MIAQHSSSKRAVDSFNQLMMECAVASFGDVLEADRALEVRVDDTDRGLAHICRQCAEDLDQLAGRSSADMYRRILLLGCRSAEIDCHNGNDGEQLQPLEQPVATKGNMTPTNGY